MTTAEQDYIESRQEWVSARKNKTIADAELEKARYRFTMARDELRAKERELLEDRVIA